MSRARPRPRSGELSKAVMVAVIGSLRVPVAILGRTAGASCDNRVWISGCGTPRASGVRRSVRGPGAGRLVEPAQQALEEAGAGGAWPGGVGDLQARELTPREAAAAHRIAGEVDDAHGDEGAVRATGDAGGGDVGVEDVVAVAAVGDALVDDQL